MPLQQDGYRNHLHHTSICTPMWNPVVMMR